MNVLLGNNANDYYKENNNGGSDSNVTYKYASFCSS